MKRDKFEDTFDLNSNCLDWNVHHVPRSKLTVEQCARRVHGNNICGDNHNYFYIWLIAQCHLSPYLGGAEAVMVWLWSPHQKGFIQEKTWLQ